MVHLLILVKSVYYKDKIYLISIRSVPKPDGESQTGQSQNNILPHSLIQLVYPCLIKTVARSPRLFLGSLVFSTDDRIMICDNFDETICWFWNENTYDDIYPFSSTQTGSHFGGAVFKDNTNYYLAGGYQYGNISLTEILEYHEDGKYQKRTVQVHLNPVVNSPNASANNLPDIPLKITNFITIQIESRIALLGGFKEGSITQERISDVQLFRDPGKA